VLAALGCHRASTTNDAPKNETTAAPTAISPRTLAMQPPNGSALVDRQIEQREAILQKTPELVAEWVTLGQLWVRKARESADPGFYLNANACVDVALSIEPNDRTAIDLRTLVLLNDHKFEEARQLAQTILDGHPEDASAWGNLSDALLELGRFEEAAHAVQQMIDLKPNLPSYSRASHVRWLQGDGKGALEIVQHAMDAGRDAHDVEPLAWVTVQAAMIFWHAGDLDGADAGFDRALAIFADFAPALVGKGRVAMARGDGKRAAELLGKAFSQSPLVETAWLLGDARTMAGDVEGARDAYAKVEKQGKLTDGRTLAAFWATRNEHTTEALALAQAETKVRGDIYTDDALAWALHRNGRDAEAKTTIDHALRLGTKDAKLLYHAGAIRVALGDRVEGETLVREAMSLNPKFDLVGAKEAEAIVGTLAVNDVDVTKVSP
jgi:tetratricopeptide (TPR) repeat protein